MFSTAAALAAEHDVTVFVSAAGEPPRTAAGDDAPPFRTVVVDEPQETGGGFSFPAHQRSSVALDALRDVYGDAGPDLVEFIDRGGEGAVTVQARITRDPFLAGTRVVIRACGSDEMLRTLDGWLPDDAHANLLHELERTSLRHADLLLVPSRHVETTYRRFYGDRDALAPVRTVRPGFRPPAAADAPGPPTAQGPSTPPDDRPLRLLVPGPLDPRRGAAVLVEALLGLDPQIPWQLTLCGPDREVGGLRTSMRAQLELTVAGDPRIAFAEDDSSLDALIAEHDVVALPARWDCWPDAALRALHAGRPLLSTPVGGLRELTVAGRSGWLAAGTSPAAIAATVASQLANEEELAALLAGDGPRAVAAEVTDESCLRAAYASLLGTVLAARPSAPRQRTRPPLVSVVIPCFGLARWVEAAVASAFAQTHPAIEVIVVNDGSAEPEDVRLQELAARLPLTLLTQENQGVGAARNLGIAQAAGRYVLPLDADNVLDARFVARAVEVLEREPQLAYVTSWTTFVDEAGRPLVGDSPGYHPSGGRGPEFERRNITGDAAALIRRRVFELGFGYRTDLVSLEDWQLWRELRDAGHHGIVMPTRLLDYRVRADSKLRTMGLPNVERLAGELLAHQRERGVRWA
ncbi:glycosyltransferase [Conexibacter woesei]|uniref:glycosyltransferase n=1 Tax=Conexibacter woesei TaxID=191495 RepID=UPI000317447A|nr:glycosyltransferase [Conexibacter woesei]